MLSAVIVANDKSKKNQKVKSGLFQAWPIKLEESKIDR